MAHAVDRARARRTVKAMDANRAARTVERLQAQADALRSMYPVNGPVPPHVAARIASKRRTAEQIESIYGAPWEAE